PVCHRTLESHCSDERGDEHEPYEVLKSGWLVFPAAYEGLHASILLDDIQGNSLAGSERLVGRVDGHLRLPATCRFRHRCPSLGRFLASDVSMALCFRHAIPIDESAFLGGDGFAANGAGDGLRL